MSNDDSTSAPAPEPAAEPTAESIALGRREAVREKAQQVHAKQSRARMLRRSALVTGVVAAVAVVGVVIGWTVVTTAGKPQLSPNGTSADGFAVASIAGGAQALEATPDDESTVEATPEGTASASPAATEQPVISIRVYLDYLSPGAREWQIANLTQLTSWVNDGAITLSYHPVSMLTAKSNGTKYSLRAASAAVCVATSEPARFFDFNNALLTRQPEVDSDGFSDTELADIAQASGVTDPKSVRTCIEEEAYASWIKSATERAVAGIPDSDVSLTQTPMILVNGQPYVGALDDPAEFSQFVMTTASDAFYDQQTATPTPTPSATPTTSPTP